MADILSDQELHAAMAERPHWEARDNALERFVQAPTFLDGINLVVQVARAAEERDHHPDIDIRYTTVSFRLSTHSAGGITAADVDLAAAIDAQIDQLGN
ncbi:MAG: 4a-hydroxytetrahydrobiopterin dehydratase [Actinomycetota bacterium]|jgi:4a-hydroxytetrahydrobiopterin dehydratase|nr:4a-hydroxytetrahydrobiopterin dehydratase [Actinomycetota bacterium]